MNPTKIEYNLVERLGQVVTYKRRGTQLEKTVVEQLYVGNPSRGFSEYNLPVGHSLTNKEFETLKSVIEKENLYYRRTYRRI